VFVALGALVGLWILGRESRRSGLPPGVVDAGMAGVIGGLLGAKLLWVMEHAGEQPLTEMLVARGGMSWFGGLSGGLGVGLLWLRYRRLPILAVLSAASPALAIGHAIGRIGCFLVGDDYGRPTSAAWGIAFPNGLPPTTVPVHPTQLYEAFALVPVAIGLLQMRRRGAPDRIVVGAYLVAVGLVRVAIEFLRVNRRVVGPLSVAHLAALTAVGIGAALMCERASLTDPEIVTLCDNIVRSQRAEIATMQRLLARH
jgi:phosphatidylglycerol:prolipoprotein diacylglycerol transferase